MTHAENEQTETVETVETPAVETAPALETERSAESESETEEPSSPGVLAWIREAGESGKQEWEQGLAKLREGVRKQSAAVYDRAQERGAGEVVLNCMNRDGVRRGYDTAQLRTIRDVCSVPLIASGGAGAIEHFRDVFRIADVDGALAASVFHSAEIDIRDLKSWLGDQGIAVRRPGDNRDH